jgi:ATP-dependent DNA helicase PIF1
MTVNKSQGQSFNFVGVDLRIPVFTHGQLYVALSRATDIGGLSVLLRQEGDAATTNIIYPEVLLDSGGDSMAAAAAAAAVGQQQGSGAAGQ